MSAFKDALADDFERELSGGDFTEDAVRIKADGTRVSLEVTTRFVSEQIEQEEGGDVVVTILRVVAPVAHRPTLEEAWELGGLRFAVTDVHDETIGVAEFEVQRRTPRRKHGRGSYQG